MCSSPAWMSQPIRRRRTAFGQADRVDAGVRGAGPLCGNAAAVGLALFPEMAVAGWEFTACDDLSLAWHFAQAVWPHRAARGGGANYVSTASAPGIKSTV